jgi:hypothetical protein
MTLAKSFSIQYTVFVLANTKSAHLVSLISIRKMKHLFLGLATEEVLIDDSTKDNVLPDANEVSRPSGSALETIDFHSSKRSALVSIEDRVSLRGSITFVKLTLLTIV